MSSNDSVENKNEVEKSSSSNIDSNKEIADTYTQNIVSKRDTMVDNYSIRFKILQLRTEIASKNQMLDSKAFDNEIILTILAGNDKIIEQHINKEDFKEFIPAEEMIYYQLSVFDFESYMNEEFCFFVNVCVPDTDICYTFNLFIDKNGKKRSVILEDEVEDDFL
ncbi:DUF4738 domain-containing protein [Sphingobacterium olei]|uniref:DUF4738 domain-containing protein n=1 Tax=Sphingobacterium olei TaxID=2571155 RepID=A0A4U0NH84_9SPHI|nr:DUF4738 domain-containing protein [Sphingobacterium olei]TJZ53557.1 DUF4738 domain-containing protein [Sphingobacterium olei]